VFNAVTRQSVLDAMEHPRQIDGDLVEAYLARRALDYLVGFTLSPVLWRKLPGARSAGRVQSVALRLICERELEIESFKTQEFWTVEAGLRTATEARFEARLAAIEGRKLGKFDIPDETRARQIEAAVDGSTFIVDNVESKAGQAPSPAALHHLDPAAGSLAQARAVGQPHHADRPEALPWRSRTRPPASACAPPGRS
jgi:DNA topoisomerase I